MLAVNSSTVAFGHNGSTYALAWIQDGGVKFSILDATLNPVFIQPVKFPDDGGDAPVDGELAMDPGGAAGFFAYLGQRDDGGRFAASVGYDNNGLALSQTFLWDGLAADAHDLSVATGGGDRFVAWEDGTGLWRGCKNATQIFRTGDTTVTRAMVANDDPGYDGVWYNFADTSTVRQGFCRITDLGSCDSSPSYWGTFPAALSYVTAISGTTNFAGVAYLDPSASPTTLNFAWLIPSGHAAQTLGDVGAAPANGYPRPSVDLAGGVFGIGYIDATGVGFASYSTLDGGMEAPVTMPFDAAQLSVQWLDAGLLGYAIAPADGGALHVGAVCLP